MRALIILLASLFGLLTVAGIAGCQSAAAPPCPFEGEEEIAPSAGCFLLEDDGLLMVQGLNGKISLPGGSSQPGESAQCTAYRETWEETGLRLIPGERLAVFDTGFHLYSCERDEQSGDIDPPPRLEVRAAFYLTPDRWAEYEWRFPDQAQLLEKIEKLKEEKSPAGYDATTEATMTP